MLISKLYVPALIVLLACSSCDLINPAEPVPAYIDLHDPELVVPASQVGTQGSASEKITNTWLFLDNRPLGVYNRTGQIPVIGEGESMITAVAGIMENGVGAVRVIYPFYTTDTTFAVLSPNADIVVDPEYKYIPSTVFSMNEGFEVGSAIETWNGSPAAIELSTADVFEGTRSARIALVDTADWFNARSVQVMTLPIDGGPIYLELNYKTDVVLQIGLQETVSGESVYNWNISPRSDWNKIYLNLQNVVLSAGSPTFRLLLRAQKPTDLQSANIFLDNVKLVHF